MPSSSIINNLRILDSWDDYFGNPEESTLGLLVALYSIGAIASLPVAPYIADHFGRKACILLGCIIMIVGAAIQGAAKNVDYFMGGRFLIGFGNSLAQLSSPLLLTELCHPQHRARVTAIYNCLWNASYLSRNDYKYTTNEKLGWCHHLHMVDLRHQAHEQ
jgi:MFS family permease